MACNFAQGDGDRLTFDSPIASPPVTLSVQFRRDGVATFVKTLVVLISSTLNRDIALRLTNSNALAAIFTHNSGTGTATSASTIPSNTWTHGALRVEVTGGNYYTVAVFANGVKTVGTSGSFTQDAIAFGAIGSTFGSFTYGGDIADVGIWSSALSDAEIISLSKGVSCSKVRPQNLAFYAPLIRNLRDIRNNRTLTAVNSPTVSNHPRIYV